MNSFVHRRYIVFAFLFLLSLLGSSCRHDCAKDNLRQMMGDWYKKKISFPEKVELLGTAQGMEKDKIVLSGASYYIVHFFMADCDKCINELLSIQKLVGRHKDETDVRYLFIASGPTQLYAKEAVEKSGFTLPVYYEKEYFSFKKKNGLPLADRLYNTMLLNSRHEVLAFGEMFQNKQAEALFYKTINCCEDE
jgi:hypothetical protein